MYCDLHVHSCLSDGVFSPEELIKMAINERITALAITDHNLILSNINELQAKYPDIELIRASEISATHVFASGKRMEIHIIGLFLEGDDIDLFLKNNKSTGRERTEAILLKLKACGIDLGSFEDIQSKFPGKHIARTQIAMAMVDCGVVDSIEDAYDIYIGDYGMKKAYVDNPYTYASIDKVCKMIQEANGLAVLAHPLSYALEQCEMEELLEIFLKSGGKAMEVFYGKYSDEEKAFLLNLAAKYGMMISCASDFHRYDDKCGRLDYHFPYAFYLALKNSLLKS